MREVLTRIQCFACNGTGVVSAAVTNAILRRFGKPSATPCEICTSTGYIQEWITLADIKREDKPDKFG